jgi:tetratricopeptide (TPR) repeat protein
MYNLNSSEITGRSQFLAINQQSLASLLTFVDFAEDLTIGFIEIDREQERDWIVEWLIESPECQDVDFLVLTYNDPNLRFLLDEILTSLSQQDLQKTKKLVLIIKGLEYSISHTEYPPILQNLNFVRDAFVDAVPYPILFCLPSYQITSIAKFAPDFWAWKSGSFKFESIEQESIPISIGGFPVKYFPIKTVPEPQSRIELLERLLEYTASSSLDRDLSTMVSIREQLGSFHRSRQEWVKAEKYLRQALDIINKNPSLSIKTTNLLIDLADIYLKKMEYEKAVEIYEHILVLDRDRLSPHELAEINNNLGLVYVDILEGNKSENIEDAINYFETALIHTAEELNQNWATIQYNLGNAYVARIKGDRSDNLEQAIKYYQVAMRVRTETDFPIDWAATQHNLATAYQERIQGDKAENLELAIDYYQATLRVYSQTNSPFNWAATQYNLGNVYCNRIRGDKAKNLELAIGYYQVALRVRTETDFPIDWAATQHNLATAYQERIQGDRAENLEMAIEYCQAALRVYTKTDFPFNWAMAQNNLGLTYTQRINGEKTENIKKAIECYQNALKIYTPDTFPREWKLTQNLLKAISTDSSS